MTSGGERVIVVFGGTVSGGDEATVQTRSAPGDSSWPTRSVARTRSTCRPAATSASVSGDVHGLGTPPSSAQRNVDGSSALNVNVAEVCVVAPCGPESIEASGFVVSIVQMCGEATA